ncbi:hypothetical protein GP486_005961 [Trichoglossum hirsutum]|uniref:Homeobox domain-containing protein n=1 Tax=Trichoglossum hirsutum TaxID=265104 RepID=A0A9P8RLA7_9PEZI|nr:hypothetical protein GP486_005961 [Trichoglossum hirsutum]
MDFVYYQAPKAAGTARRKDEDNGDSSAPQADIDDKTSTAAQPAEKRTDPITSSAEENEEPEVSTRPRLTREQVFLLEQQFQAAPKPSTSTKKKLAETTGLSMPRVGNWFQNRRAKAKQQKKQAEAEMLRTLESAGRRSYTEPSSPDFYYYSNYSMPDIDHAPYWAQLNPVPIDQPNGVTGTAYGCAQYKTPSEACYASLSRSIAAATAAVAQGFDRLVDTKPEVSTHGGSSFYPGAMAPGVTGDVQYPMPVFSDYSGNGVSSVAWAPVASHREDSFDMNSQNMQQLQVQQPNQQDQQQQQSSQEVCNKLSGAIETSNSGEAGNLGNPFLVPALPSQVLRDKYGPKEQESQPESAPESSLSRRGSCSSELVNSFNVVDLQPREREFPLQETDGPVNIAARRNRPRPATLALRGRSFMGNVPVSPTAKTQFLGPSSPMHRIKSAGSNLNLMRGRVQKGMPPPAQRSPLNFESFLAAGAFQESAVNGISPTTSATPGTSISVSGSLAPPTPSSPLDLERLQSEGVSGTGDADASYIFSPEYPGCFVPTTVEMQTNLASPPTTPLDAANYINMTRYHQSHHASPSHLPAPSSVPEESMLSSEFTSYSSTIHMPQPVYVSPISCSDSDMASLLQFSDTSHGSNMDAFCGSTPTIPEFFYQEPSPTAPSFAPPPPPPPPLPQQNPPSTKEILPKPKNFVFTTNQGPEDF